MATISIDAAQYYDRVNHLIMGLAWLALIDHIGSVPLALMVLQTMSFIRGHVLVTQPPSLVAFLLVCPSADWGKVVKARRRHGSNSAPSLSE